MIDNIYIRTTGDPFIDTGGLVLKRLAKEYPNKEIIDHIEYATSIYVNRWNGKLHTYFLNSSITQPAFNAEKKISETLKYYRSLLIDSNADFKNGFCRIIGSESRLYATGRNNHMMSGSGTFLNYHSAFESGLYLSKEALIRTFFVPLGVSFVGDKIALLQSNYDDVNYFLVSKNVDENIRNIASGIGEGTLKSEFGIMSNALFNFADICVGNLEIATYNDNDSSKLNDVQLNLYHFTNFGASPDIEIHSFSNILFKFYAHCKKHYSKEWNTFINQNFKYSKFKDAEYDSNTNEWFNKKERLTYNDYKTWSNPILVKLIKNISILSHLSKWSRNNKFSFNIIEIYCVNILKMDKYTIQKIKELSDFIIDNKSDDQIKKSVVRLNGLKNGGEFRSYLIKLIKDNYDAKNTTPLITLEDYVIYLFPDGTYWKDTRDLLLISIYQKLHEINVLIEELNNEELDEEEEII